MKIQAKNENIKSMKLIVPIDGMIDIDSNGTAEVSKKCAEMLINGTNDWEMFSDDKEDSDKKKVDEQGSESGEEQDFNANDNTEDGEDEGEGEKQPTDEEIIEGLSNLSLEDCIATAKEAKYPKKEWEKLSKNEKAAETLMRKYLIKKYKESIKEA